MAVASTELVTGIVLAAGAGSRAGGPKALLRSDSGEPWLHLAVRALLDGGCHRAVVVLGAEARRARPLVPSDADIVVARAWRRGMSESLRSGLAAATGDAALISLVDLPTLPAQVVRRVLDGQGELRRAVFRGRPGHPVFVSTAHWTTVAESLEGDHGAQRHLESSGAAAIECGDLWDGVDDDLGMR